MTTQRRTSGKRKAKPRTRTFGERLAELREAAGLSQSGLARRIGISQSAISQMEAGERNPSYGMLVQLADGVNVSIAALVAGDEKELLPTPCFPVRRRTTSDYVTELPRKSK